MNAPARLSALDRIFPPLRLPPDMPAQRREQMAAFDREASRWATEYLAGREPRAVAAELRAKADRYVAEGQSRWMIERCRDQADLLDLDPRLLALTAAPITGNGTLAFDLFEYSGLVRGAVENGSAS